MAVELTFSATLNELPGVYEWINNLKKSVSPTLSYGICAKFAKLIGRENYGNNLASIIRVARRFSNGTASLEKFEDVLADVTSNKDCSNYEATIGMLMSAISRGDISETIILVEFTLCYWQDRPFTEVCKRIMRTINKINKEVER